jgi:hypothetical protein
MKTYLKIIIAFILSIILLTIGFKLGVHYTTKSCANVLETIVREGLAK